MQHILDMSFRDDGFPRAKSECQCPTTIYSFVNCGHANHWFIYLFFILFIYLFLFFIFLNFKIFNSYMRKRQSSCVFQKKRKTAFLIT